MRIACYQGPELAHAPADILALLRRAAFDARAGGADLLVAPEMFLTGYAIGAAAVARVAEPVDGPSVKAAAEVAREAGIALAFGLPERGADGGFFNSAVAISAEGKLLASYRKAHLFGDVDREQFSAGAAEPQLFEVCGVTTAMLICYDVEFPEAVRSLALRGVDLVVVPTALMQPYDVVARTVVPARAFENQIFVAYANRCGLEPPFDYSGLSCVVGPDGVDVSRAGRGEELIFADLDTDLLARSRQANTYLTDRRPELYQGIARQMESQP